MKAELKSAERRNSIARTRSGAEEGTVGLRLKVSFKKLRSFMDVDWRSFKGMIVDPKVSRRKSVSLIQSKSI
jgi:hypothetical protein